MPLAALRVHAITVGSLTADTRCPHGRLAAPTGSAYAACMCRNIRQLYNFDPPSSEDEVRAAAVQYVRKVGGFSKPSKANEEAYERAVDAVAAATAHLLDELVTTAPPKDREVEAAKARARSAARFAVQAGRPSAAA
ncbi:MAG: hypothetical protein JWO02_2833 [Solirubrobacterales bacterium]|nr:hypothetical protein [Solirubrobacterales bacterium]